MKIVVDSFIPFIRGVLEPYAEVVYAEPAAFTPALVRDADALVIRTRVRCNAALLDGSAVRFIATATIGYDHIDAAYCACHGITWINAAGCNADGVRQYVQAVLEYVERIDGVSMAGKTLGVVGVGHVGRLVSAMAERKGMRVLRNDPPRQLAEPDGGFVSLEQLARESDVITFHTPLALSGEFATYHLCDAAFLQKIRPDALLINAARGGVVDEEAFLAYAPATCRIVLDCWEHEPHISRPMLDRVLLGTPHIAGYTVRGKQNATTMSVQALSRFFGLGLDGWEAVVPPSMQPATDESDIVADYRTLLQHTAEFEHLRSSYRLR